MYFHTKIITAPTAMPAIAPFLLERLQKSDRSMTGPKVAPKPAHAKDTIWNTELFGSDAKMTAMIAMMRTVLLASFIAVFSLIFICRKSLIIFCEKLDEAARSCESDVDIVAASIPARTTPARRATANPFSPRSPASLTIIVSDPEPVRGSIAPALVTLYPTIPITIATASDITTQVVAILLESFSFSRSSIAMNLRRM